MLPVDADALYTAVKVLHKVSTSYSRREFLKDPELKALRKALFPLAAVLMDVSLPNRIQRLLACEGTAEARMQNTAASVRKYKREQDERLRNKTTLSAGRAAGLEALLADMAFEAGPPSGTDTVVRLDGPVHAVEEAFASPGVLHLPSKCYVCRAPHVEVHHFYPRLCPACGDFNFAKRHQTVSFAPGTVAVVTGARIKIGYCVAVKLLRAGATVVGTTRFPRDAIRRYSAEPDAAAWLARLSLYPLDLRCAESVAAFVRDVAARHPRVHILVNNACQTIRRPAPFYRHLLSGEECGEECGDGVGVGVGVVAVAAVMPLMLPGAKSGVQPVAQATQQVVVAEDALTDAQAAVLFPPGVLDVHGQQVDVRKKTSWTHTVRDVEPGELAEVFMVNAMAPFTLVQGMLPLLQAATSAAEACGGSGGGLPCRAFVVNVSSMEGVFARHYKAVTHPHTNMAKAALNMFTRTSGPDLARVGIFMTAVDTGWVTDEQPVRRGSGALGTAFQPPLDEVDGAARVLDPVFSVYNVPGVAALHSVLLKDYVVHPW